MKCYFSERKCGTIINFRFPAHSLHQWNLK